MKSVHGCSRLCSTNIFDETRQRCRLRSQTNPLNKFKCSLTFQFGVAFLMCVRENTLADGFLLVGLFGKTTKLVLRDSEIVDVAI